MNSLESPLEALALDYLSFGLLTVVNNVWTWVAVVTAAFSVWRFKALSTLPPRGKFPDAASSPVEKLAAELPLTSPKPVVIQAAKPSISVASTPSLSAQPRMFNAEGKTSGKFTVYYDRKEEEEVRGDDGNGEVDGEEGCNKRGEIEKQWFGEGTWEVTMRMRIGDHMGFYRYQDVTVLDGSVVRLWDGCRSRNGGGGGGGGCAAPAIMCVGGEVNVMW